MSTLTSQSNELLHRAVEIRNEITGCYSKYRQLQGAAVLAAAIKPSDLKRAVDAIYYLGGGWPTETSKGRLEALLDNFVGVYRVLKFIGKGNLVEEHLSLQGVSVSLAADHEITNLSLSHNDLVFLNNEYNIFAHGVIEATDTCSLITQIIDVCLGFQREICSKADEIKLHLRPAVCENLGVEDEEYDRLHNIVKLNAAQKKQRAQKKRDRTKSSISAYEDMLRFINQSNIA